MQQLFCENPVILQNHRLGYYLSIWKLYQTPAGVKKISKDEAAYYRYSFPAYRYSVKRLFVTIDNIDQYNVISPDGETYPMFIAVPCSRCTLCRDKKKRDWSFRATCENVYSTSRPLFLTLTYNNKNLPKHGVFKEEIQLFLKRLRIKLDRSKITHSFRYFAVGEYGSKSGRPHYHLIFWSFPTEQFYNPTSVLHFIENAWKVQTYQNGQPQYNLDGSPKTESLGFALCKPCDNGAISYVMKYMRKEAVLPPNSNPVFFLSSRKNGGLGAQYARDQKSFYYENPQTITMTVTDPYSSKEITQSMPGYFKRLYFPSNSTVVDKYARDSFKRLALNIAERFSIEKQLAKLTAQPYQPHVSESEKKIFKKFWFIKQPVLTNSTQLYNHRYQNYEKLYHQLLILELQSASECRYLNEISYDNSYIISREKMLLKRQKSLDYFYGSKEPTNINDVKYRLIQALNLAQSKEIL